MAYDGWVNANVPKKKNPILDPLTPEEEAERARLLELVPDGPPPRKRGKKAVPISGDKLVAVLSFNGIEFTDGRSRD
jgi:hypothetical protein